jgi:hypothetical protein
LTMAYGKLLFVHFMEYVKKRISFDMLWNDRIFY